MTRFKYFAILVTLLLISCKSSTDTKQDSNPPPSIQYTDTIKTIESEKHIIDYDTSNWVEIKNSDSIQLDIRYATPNNFMNQSVYPCGRCFIRKSIVSEFYGMVNDFQKDSYQVVLFDCYRPLSIQEELWKMKPDPRFVTDPKKGSMHNRGVALDISLLKNGSPVDMGTEYDFFGEESFPDNQKVSPNVYENRQYLKETMKNNGFSGINSEWWHFSVNHKAGSIEDWNWFCPSE